MQENLGLPRFFDVRKATRDITHMDCHFILVTLLTFVIPYSLTDRLSALRNGRQDRSCGNVFEPCKSPTSDCLRNFMHTRQGNHLNTVVLWM